jgi:regulator of replication initiation timing
MAGAMKGVTKALISMNKKMDLPGLQKVMSDFMRENEKSEITQEALADALDDAMEEEGSSEQEENIVNQVRSVSVSLSILITVHYTAFHDTTLRCTTLHRTIDHFF